MSGRSIMTDFEVSFKPLSSVFLCNLSLFVQNGRNLAKRFSDVSDRDIYTPNLSNFPVPAGILKHLSSVIG